MPVNLRQLAEKLELSTTTVSRALAGYSDVSSDTRHRVREAAKKHNYHPNPVAQRLQKGKTETIGIVLSPGQNYFKDTFFLDLLSGISVSLGKIGFDLTISVAPDSQHEIDSLHRMVQGKRVDGIILTLTKAQDERISYLLDKNFPFILYGRTEDPRPHAFLDMDGELAFRESCKYLIDLGHKRIALINLSRIQEIINKKKISLNTKINLQNLQKSNLINNKYKKLKLLGSGDIKEKFDFEVDFISKSAKEKIEKNGSSIKLTSK